MATRQDRQRATYRHGPPPVVGPSTPRRPRSSRSSLRSLGLLLASVLLGATGCLGHSGGGQVPVDAKLVQIYHMAFRPSIVRVKVGQPVTWRFEDAQVDHDVDAINGGFESPVKDSGTWTHVFARPGTYPYRCSIHTYMTGEVIVTAAMPAATRS